MEMWKMKSEMFKGNLWEFGTSLFYFKNTQENDDYHL